MRIAVVLLAWSVPLKAVEAGPPVPPPLSPTELNEAFLAQLDDGDATRALAVAAVRRAYTEEYRPDEVGFVPEALARLYPVYDEALRAMDAGAPEVALDLLRGIDGDDPYLRANAGYWQLRMLAELGRFEELVALAAEPQLGPAATSRYTPYTEQIAILRATALLRTLDFEQAERILAEQMVRTAPELVRNVAYQLQLELDRRDPESLGDIARYMDYVRQRLAVPDTGVRVRERQDEIVAMLDKLIEEAEQNEQGGGGGGSGSGKRAGEAQPGGPQGQQQPTAPADESSEGSGQGRIGDLHAAPRVDPGEMWGKLPPDERERILQSIRERFPSRYRQLVEQYYRALAEQP